MRRKNQYGNSSNNPNNKKEEEACLTMHQPWASLLVYGIKRIEGRSWPSPLRGRLWIHAASKVPDAETIRAMEDFYREIYALDGVTDLNFPKNYPVSSLVGCIEVVGCLRREELACWRSVPQGVRLEALTNFCWLCENPQKLVDPVKMRGDQGVYTLERKISELAVRGLLPVDSPLSIKFPFPNPGDSYSLRPGSLRSEISHTRETEAEKPPSLIAAIAGAKAAAMQFSRKDNQSLKDKLTFKNMVQSEIANKLEGSVLSEKGSTNSSDAETVTESEGKSKSTYEKKQHQQGSNSLDESHQRLVGRSQLFSAAMKGIRPE